MCKKSPSNNLPSLQERHSYIYFVTLAKHFHVTAMTTMKKENNTLLPGSKPEQDAIGSWSWNWLVYASMLQ